jgi:hypothetical protein
LNTVAKRIWLSFLLDIGLHLHPPNPGRKNKGAPTVHNSLVKSSEPDVLDVARKR